MNLKEIIMQTLYEGIATRKQPTGASPDHYSMDYKTDRRVSAESASVYVDGNIDLGHCADKIIETLVEMEVPE